MNNTKRVCTHGRWSDQCSTCKPTTGSESELNYGNYKGSARHERGYWYGKILNIKDLVTYESENFEGLKEEFCMAVDDWIETRNNLDTQSATKPTGAETR